VCIMGASMRESVRAGGGGGSWCGIGTPPTSGCRTRTGVRFVAPSAVPGLLLPSRALRTLSRLLFLRSGLGSTSGTLMRGWGFSGIRVGSGGVGRVWRVPGSRAVPPLVSGCPVCTRRAAASRRDGLGVRWLRGSVSSALCGPWGRRGEFPGTQTAGNRKIGLRGGYRDTRLPGTAGTCKLGVPPP
jgi:hypothetical protein